MSEELCPICLVSLEGYETVITNCNHIFHRECMLQAVDNEIISCPMCRQGLNHEWIMETFTPEDLVIGTGAPEFWFRWEIQLSQATNTGPLTQTIK